jgi:O-antigen ligase
LVIAVNKIKEKPILGRGAASAWPASHHLWEWKEYNPENQYLQIWIEYGLIAFIGWMYLYLFLNFVWFKAFKDDYMDEKSSKEMKNLSLIIFAFSLWMIGLSIEWLVLHSFVDRMIVYPFIALFGIYYASYYRAKLYGTENKKALYEK